MNTTTDPTVVANLNKAREAAVASGQDPYAGSLKSYSTFGSAPTTPITSSSTTARADVNALGNVIKTLQAEIPSPDEAKLRELGERESRAIQAERDVLSARRDAEIAGINSSFGVLETQTKGDQKREYAGRSTGLVTSGGGFLGATQSQEGVLQNMSVTHRNELTAIESKKQAAIQAARNAFSDKDFALARDQVKLAREAEKEAIAARRQFAQDQLSVVQEMRAELSEGRAASAEKRAATTSAMSIADKKIEAFSLMDDKTFASQKPEEIALVDNIYYPGYTASARKVAQEALKIKNQKDAITVDTAILDMRLKIPKGQSFKIGGVQYSGLKEPEKVSSDVVKSRVEDDVASIVMDFQKQIKARGWAGVNPEAYDYYREQLAKSYGASAALKLDEAMKKAELSLIEEEPVDTKKNGKK